MPSTRNIIMIAVICVATLVAGYFLSGQIGGGSTSASLTATPVAQSGQVGSDLVVALQRLKSVTLDASIFSDAAFQSLTDFGVTIPPQQLGRPNPFAPIATSSAQLSNAITLPSVLKTFTGGGR